jgi:hypothetical protein
MGDPVGPPAQKWNVECHTIGGVADFNILSLIMLWKSKSETREVVHAEKNERRNNKSVTKRGDRIAELIGDLDIMMIDPPALDNSYTVECSDVIGGKYTTILINVLPSHT